MSSTPISAPQRTPASTPSRSASHTPAVHHADAKALADEFSAAARKGLMPLGQRTGKDGKPIKLGPDGKPLPPPPTALAKALGYAGKGSQGQSETRRDDSNTATLTLAQSAPTGFATPMQAPPPVAAHVDPSVFADMLTRIWTREQGKTAREVRVQFGDDAWPATGARLLRLEDGTLQVTVSMGQRGADAGLEGLRERLEARGLHVSDIAVEDDV